MAVALVAHSCYRPFFQAVVAPIKLIYAIFLIAVGYLLSFFGVKEWGKAMQIKGKKIDSRCTSLFTGLWAYGRRFLVHGDNYEQSCRGSCYWIIHEHLRHPEKPLTELAKAFEEGAPKDAIAMHRNNAIPKGLIETKWWSQCTTFRWPPMPRLDPGIYTFLVGFSKDVNTPCEAHRIAFFKQKETLLFDPNTGLSKWAPDDWEPLLNRIKEKIQTEQQGFFTLECYAYK